MSLTSHLNSSRSPVRAFLRERFPHVSVWLRTEATKARHDLAERGGTLLLPPSVEGDKYPYSTVGMAFDYRLRFSLEVPERRYIATRGLFVLARLGFLTKDTVETFNHELAAHLEKTVPWSRSLSLEDEAQLNRFCVVLAWGEQLIRSGMAPSILEARPEKLSALFELIKQPWLDDLAALATLWKESSRHLAPQNIVLNPTFAGSGGVGGADADFILDGCLFDMKTTVRSGWQGQWLYQLLGYVLLDFVNEHEIKSVGLYLARHGMLCSWPLQELLETFAGQSVNLNLWRNDLFGVTEEMREQRQLRIEAIRAQRNVPARP